MMHWENIRSPWDASLLVYSWENVAPGRKYLPKQPALMKAFSQALSSPRALPALCCQNLGDVPRPGAEHVPAN